jgi:subtilisin family serine protease
MEAMAAGQLVPYGTGVVKPDPMTDVDTSSRKVRVTDYGYDGGHEDLDHSANVIGDLDPGGSGSWSVHQNHHGTHVASTIAALDNAGTGDGLMLALSLRAPATRQLTWTARPRHWPTARWAAQPRAFLR